MEFFLRVAQPFFAAADLDEVFFAVVRFAAVFFVDVFLAVVFLVAFFAVAIIVLQSSIAVV